MLTWSYTHTYSHPVSHPHTHNENHRPYLCLVGSILFHSVIFGFCSLSPPLGSLRLDQSLPLLLSPTLLAFATGLTRTTGFCSQKRTKLSGLVNVLQLAVKCLSALTVFSYSWRWSIVAPCQMRIIDHLEQTDRPKEAKSAVKILCLKTRHLSEIHESTGCTWEVSYRECGTNTTGKNLISTQNKAVAGVNKSLNKMEQTGALPEVMYAMTSSLSHKAAATASRQIHHTFQTFAWRHIYLTEGNTYDGMCWLCNLKLCTE